MRKKGQKVTTGEVLTSYVEPTVAYEPLEVKCSLAESSCNDAVRAALKETNVSQMALSKKLGYEGASTLSYAINSKRMSVEKLLEMLGGLGYSVIVAKDTKDGYALRCVLK